MKFLTIALVVGLAGASCVSAAPEKVDCSKISQIIEEYNPAQGFSALSEKYPIPKTAEELTKRCGEMTEAIKILRKYSNECYTSLTQQIFSAVLRGREQQNVMRCAPNSPEFKEGLEALKCASENALDNMRKAENETIAIFQSLLDANIADDKMKIRRTCCAIHETRKIFLDSTKEKCEKHVNIFTEHFDSYSKDSMALICLPQKELECDKLERIKTDGIVLRSNVFLVPMMGIVKSLYH